MAVSFVQFRERILKPVLKELQNTVKRINVSHSKSFKGCFFFLQLMFGCLIFILSFFWDFLLLQGYIYQEPFALSST